MEYYVLASGSKGNCTVISDGDSTIVIDAGTTDRHLKAAFSKIDIDYKNIDALLITHTHIDHINRLNLFKDSLMYTPEILDPKFKQVLLYGEESFKINSFEIQTITLSHDRELTVGFIIKNSRKKLVYVTDTGYFKNKHLPLIKDADYYIFESNHDPEMLMQTNRPFSLKQRIMAMNGHLSNDDCGKILKASVSQKTKEIVLAHLSEEANCPKLAYQTISSHLNNGDIEIKVAKQFEIVKGGNNEN